MEIWRWFTPHRADIQPPDVVTFFAVNWRVKGLVQRALGYVPAGERIHYALQRRGGGLTNFARECDLKVEDWRLMMGHLRSTATRVAGATLLEMGTGWYPTFPLALYLAGAGTIHTFDLNRHLKPDLVHLLVDRLGTHTKVIADESGRDEAGVSARLNVVSRAVRAGASIFDATEGAIAYHAPADATATGLPTSSVDVVFSNSVLEHVPERVIEACLSEAKRILRPGAIVFHSVNCGDHYAYVDRSISQLNYLMFSDEEWAPWDNAFLYQNRLRAVDFIDLAKRAGFAIEVDTSRASAQRLDQLATLNVHSRFAKYSREQLAITSIDFVGRAPRQTL